MAFALTSRPASSLRKAAKTPIIQTKLKVGTPNDVFEREADRVADEIVRTPQRLPSSNMSPLRNAPPSIQRMCTACTEEDQKIRRLPSRTADRDTAVSAPLEQSIYATHGRGSPLETSTRRLLERRFGREFSSVRIHSDQTSGEFAQQLQSRAFTVGSDIFFAPGEFAPHTSSGLRVLSHELTHVVQQGAVPAATSAFQSQVRLKGGAARSVQRQPADDVDCGDPNVIEPSLNCEGRGRNGPGVVFSTPAGWELRNFDIDKHFLKPEHSDALKAILPALQTFLKAQPGKKIHLTGEASTTAGTCYNLRLSRRRARCVAKKLVELGIPSASLDVSWIGDIESEQRLAMIPDPTPTDIENPDDRRVKIEILTEGCSPDVKTRPSRQLDFRFGCLSSTKFSVVIADNSQTPAIHREFVWEKMFSPVKTCEFFPDLDPGKTLSSDTLAKPVRLAWTEDPLSPSDFSDLTIQRSIPIKGDLDNVIAFFGNGEEFLIEFPGRWDPASCEAVVRSGTEMLTFGSLKPVGPVECGPMPVPKSVPCRKPPKHPCPERESSASHFKASIEPVGTGQKITEWFGDHLDGKEVRFFRIGTAKTDDEKKSSGGDIWRQYIFTGKVIYGPEGCEQRDPSKEARGEKEHGDPEQLSEINLRPAKLTRVADSNVTTLWIAGFGTFKLLSDKCTAGKTEILLGSVEAWGDVHCEPMDMEDPPAEQTCTDDCPEARRTCPHDLFRFKVGRIDPATAPPEVRRVMAKIGCDAQAARVNIGAVSALKPIWRPFYWVQQAPCPFTIQNATLTGAGGKLTIGVKPKLQFKWPPVTLDPVASTDGLRLATKNPDDPLAPSEFSMATELDSSALSGSAKSTDVGISGATLTTYKMRTYGAPVDWTGTCKTSDKGILIPAGKVECGWPPAPSHDPGSTDTCSAGPLTIGENLGFLLLNRALFSELGMRAGMIQTVTYPDGSALYHDGQIVKDTQFIGQVFDSKGQLTPVVIRFDMRVLSYIKLPGRVDVLFTILSRPCAYENGITPVPIRFFQDSCADDIREGQTIKIGHNLPTLGRP